MSDVDLRVVRGAERRVSQLLVAGVRAQYELGLEIRKIKEERLWTAWPDPPKGGWPTGPGAWNTWCYHVLGYRERKADYLAKNAVDLRALNLGDDVLVRALRVGWYRLAEVLRVAKTEKMLIEWIDYIDSQKPSLDDLRAAIKVALGGEPDPGPEEPDDTTETEPSSPEPPKKVYKWQLQFEDAESQKTFVRAINLIKRRLGDMGTGRAAALMATAYMAALPREDEGGVVVELETLIQAIEKNYRVKLGVVETTADAVGEF